MIHCPVKVGSIIGNVKDSLFLLPIYDRTSARSSGGPTSAKALNSLAAAKEHKNQWDVECSQDTTTSGQNRAAPNTVRSF